MTAIAIRNPDALVSTGWLEARLKDRSLRVFDCTTQLVLDDGGNRPYRIVSRRDSHDAGHIPGASHLDLQADFSNLDSPFGMTLADPRQVLAAFERNGVGDGTKVVLYSRGSMSWSTRFWWMLRWLGFDNAAVLNGGFDKWEAEGKPISTASCAYPEGRLTLRLRPEVFVGKDTVLSAISDNDTCTVNALGTDVHSGQNPRYGRPGRIPGSVNVPQISLVDADTLEFLPAATIAKRFAEVGAHKGKRHITYCGGGIFATVNAFWLHQLGHLNVAVYDNSMSEWGRDESLPVEID